MAEAALTPPAVVVKNKGLLTAAIMLATVMQVLDTTIANVALPHMRASLSASEDEINWVLTSYIVASAIATPLTGWLSDRLGRRMLLLLAVASFTAASVLCGMATSLEQMVLFRVIQGVGGAMMVPLAQAILLDINPREKLGQAMAIFGAGIMIGPIIGPTLGGWLTESFNWRAVFLVNLPVGILAFIALLAYMPKSKIVQRPFDFFGFAILAMAVAATQMILDRGQQVGWFVSIEIWTYLGLAISGVWVFIVHCATAEHPFVDLAMFKDRNFSSGVIFMGVIGITTFSSLALLPPLLQGLMGYPVIETGMVMAPRGWHHGVDDPGGQAGFQGRCAPAGAGRHRHFGVVAVDDGRFRHCHGAGSDHVVGPAAGAGSRPGVRAAVDACLRHHPARAAGRRDGDLLVGAQSRVRRRDFAGDHGTGADEPGEPRRAGRAGDAERAADP